MSSVNEILDPSHTDVTTEAAVVALLAERATSYETLTRGDLVRVGVGAVDLDRYADEPRRTKGTVTLHTVESLVTYVNVSVVDSYAACFVDRDAARFAVVLNGDRKSVV